MQWPESEAPDLMGFDKKSDKVFSERSRMRIVVELRLRVNGWRNTSKSWPTIDRKHYRFLNLYRLIAKAFGFRNHSTEMRGPGWARSITKRCMNLLR